MKVYVASSWRNDYQLDVVKHLRDQGHEVYDFKSTEGFHWRDIDPMWESWTFDQYVANLSHPLAVDGYNSDLDAMKWADACVLVLPCGRSAHLEAGWFVGANKHLIIYNPPTLQIEPELMNKMAGDTHITNRIGQVLALLKSLDTK